MTSFYICQSSKFGSLEDTVRLCETNGYGIELSDFSDIAVLSDSSLIRTIACRINRITGRALHGPYLEMNPVSEDIIVRNNTLNCFRMVYDRACDLQIKHIILHPVFNPLVFSPQEWIKKSVVFWKEYLKGKSAEIHFHLENVMDAGPEVLLELVKRVNQPNLDINLDIGHVHAYSKVPLPTWISTIGQRIGYVHLHDNNGQADEHIGLGQGNLPLEEVCRFLQYYAPEAIWAIESGGIGTTQSLTWLYQHGFIAEPSYNVD